jgi:radical SAM superfamily enzyme YgiQ (UPF0313 family)
MKKIFFVRISPNIYFKNPHPQNVIIPFDIAQIISLLPKKKFKISVIDTWVDHLNADQIVEKINKTQPDFLAITAETPVAEEALKIFQKAKQSRKNLLTIAFGPHATFSPETFLYQKSPVDVCILGEPEVTMIELINKNTDFRKISGLAFFKKKIQKNKLRELIENLDKLPFLAHEYFLKDNRYQALFPAKILCGKSKWGFLLSSRGCPYNCNFCSPSIRNSYGKKFRSQSPKRVVKEMEYLNKNLKVNAIVFEDDVFSLNMNRVEKICEEIIKRKLKISFVIQTRADKLNQRLIKRLKEAGCTSITLGIESADSQILKSTRKGVEKKQILKTVNQIKKAGIEMKLNFIVGWPGENLKKAQKTLALAKQLNPLYAHFHFLTPYPGTEIYQKFIKGNVSFDQFSHCNLGKINLSLIKQKDYQSLLKTFYKNYYLSFGYLQKHFGFHFIRFITSPNYYLKRLKEVYFYLFLNSKQ